MNEQDRPEQPAHPDGASPAPEPIDRLWEQVHRRVADTLPRLADLAARAALLYPIFGPLGDDFWGGGGRGGGC